MYTVRTINGFTHNGTFYPPGSRFTAKSPSPPFKYRIEVQGQWIDVDADYFSVVN
jgi:hypothetical protein